MIDIQEKKEKMIYLNRCFYIKIISQKMEKTISHCLYIV